AYRGANGVKTGYTSASGWCLVASATRHGRTLIAVVLDSPNIYGDARTLLNLGFSHNEWSGLGTFAPAVSAGLERRLRFPVRCGRALCRAVDAAEEPAWGCP